MAKYDGPNADIEQLVEAARTLVDWDWNELAMTDPGDGTVGSQMTAEESMTLERHMDALAAALEPFGGARKDRSPTKEEA
jgi:hypothetical protein